MGTGRDVNLPPPLLGWILIDLLDPLPFLPSAAKINKQIWKSSWNICQLHLGFVSSLLGAESYGISLPKSKQGPQSEMERNTGR